MKVFKFTDYKQFLWQFIKAQPKKGRGMVKAMGEHLSIDPSQVSQVLSGSKEFTEEQSISICQFVGLNELETEYFLTLNKIERAGTKLLKDHYKKKLEKLKEQSLDLKEHLHQDRILNDYEKSIFYSSYLYSAIRLSTSIADGQSISEIAERFQLSRDKIAAILNFLLSSNLCAEKNGKYLLGTQHTHVESGSPFLARHHHNWRVKALERTDHITNEELQFTGPVSISREDFQEVRELLIDVISKSLAKVKKSEPTEVACLLIDWFLVQK